MLRPRRTIRFELALTRDNGELLVAERYRVPHNDARGPMKGDLRYHPSADENEVSALVALMTWKTALRDTRFGGPRGAWRPIPGR